MYSLGFREIVLVVKDVEASTRFYTEVVGLKGRRTGPDWTWLEAGDPERREWIGLHKGTLLFEKPRAAPRGERWGPIHYALRVRRDRLEEAAAHVRSKGVEVLGPHEFGDGGLAYYFYDPDDNLVEFYSYPDG